MLRTAFLQLLLASVSSGVFAQGDPQFIHQVASSKGQNLPARDFWITAPKKYDRAGSGAMGIHIVSKKYTTAHIQLPGGLATDIAITPLKASVYTVSGGWELATSGIVENKGIRVWSDDADLSVFVVAFSEATSAGMNILPVTGWGKEYVVAAYNAYNLFVGLADLPSEFAIVAGFDSTVIQVTLAANVRVDGKPTEILHKANETFTIVLNRGQTVQYVTTLANASDSFDLTGTVVTSSKPIGVFGASQCPCIPSEFSHCDFICEMLPPQQAWGTTYHTVPFSGKKSDSFCMIASTDDQKIYRNGKIVTTLSRHKRYFRPDVDSVSLWSSDAPFLLTQYLNSKEWEGQGGLGDPAMVVICPVEQYQKEVLFEVYDYDYTNYANIIIHKNAELSATLDGIPINSYPNTSRFDIPFSDYVAFRAKAVKGNAHLVKSDSTLTVYAYGYRTEDTYAWNGGFGTRRFSVLDSIAPKIKSVAEDCFCARIAFSDIHPHKTGIASFVVDSITNIQFTQDPQFSFASDTSFYDICVKEPSKSGYIRVSIYDNAGNRTTVESRINARIAPKVAPVSLALPYAGAGIPTTETFTLQNTTGAPLAIAGPSGLRLVGTGTGFAIELPDPSDIPTDGSREFTVTFAAPDSLVRRDTIVIGNECGTISLPLASYYPGPPAPLANLYNFGCILFGTTKDSMIGIMNPVVDLTIDTMWIDDPTYFKISPLQFPFTLEKGTWFYIHVTYYADKLDTARSTLRVVTIEQGESHTTLQGCAVTAGTVRTEISYSEADLRSSLERGNTFAWLAPSPNPAERLSSISFTFGLSERQSVGLELFDLLGKQVAAIPQQQFEGGVHELSLQTNSLVSGAYIYRYLVNGIPYSGMMTIR